jgi:hypothetical protein
LVLFGFALELAVETHEGLGVGQDGHGVDLPRVVLLEEAEAHGGEDTVVVDLGAGAIALDGDGTEGDLAKVARVEKFAVVDALEQRA